MILVIVDKINVPHKGIPYLSRSKTVGDGTRVATRPRARVYLHLHRLRVINMPQRKLKEISRNIKM